MLTNVVLSSQTRGPCKKVPCKQRVIKFAKPAIGCSSQRKGANDRQKLLLQFINQMVAVAFELKPDDLLNNERGNARKSRARQVSMYLMNVALSRTFIEIGEYYRRDRTTVSHACAVVEELRDIPAFDDRLVEFERTITLVIALSDPFGAFEIHE